MSADDNGRKKKYKKQRYIGLVLIIVGFVLMIVGLWSSDFLNMGLAVGGIVLFFIGLCLVIPSSKRIPIKQLPVESQVDLYGKKFKSKTRFGIALMVIGIVLNLFGILIWVYTQPYLWGYGYMMIGIMLWVIGGVLFFIGVGYLIDSVFIKKRMKKLEGK